MPANFPAYQPLSFGDSLTNSMFPVTSAAYSGSGVPATGAAANIKPSNWSIDWAPAPAQVPIDTSALSGLANPAAPSAWDSFKNWWDNSGIMGKTMADGSKLQGWGGLALGAGQGLMNGFMGLQQYGLAKQQLAEGKRQFDTNYAAQAKTINARLEDQARSRVASNPTAYQSVGDYMKKYGI